ncbi:dipeptide ABC transporter ATP-binding protein [Actinosynnema mirum]|uniref:ABC transporter related n=1 Tax=Actinosynnema mirum (strain ATCC 29888 / DSM 43827 / JCM 3225 / NBRC 14064 / NCIMB 13271 / NRRL B-12336 / IMRU 3971 / 101) TaxID=446462 RepID=C6WL43_ACTMD|nr:ABC transporter ATP-binding protein [Actinosynnema mirum]ACU36396.1 ABC transporter related [Actinosynnema mirum DSM 43827]
MTGPLLELDAVGVEFTGGGATTVAARDVTLSLAAGEVLAVVGESGSGKTVTAMSLLRLLPSTAVLSGRALLDSEDLFGMGADALRAVRGGRIGVVFQEPMTALNPVFTIGHQLAEAVLAHREVSGRQARARALELLELVGLPDAEAKLRRYPHELSGGQLQRVVIAMAVANEPALLIADEPTTALDVTVQAEVVELLRDLRDRLGTAILLITHDMGVVASLADRVAVMKDGRVVEQGGVEAVFGAPEHEYTRSLLDAVLSLSTTPSTGAVAEVVSGSESAEVEGAVEVLAAGADAALVVDGLTVVYGGGWRGAGTRAVDGVSLHVGRGEVLGLVGESGSGKTTLASVVAGLRAPTSGSVLVGGLDVARLRGARRKAARGRVGVVFQDPTSSLNPRAPVWRAVAEPLVLHRGLRGVGLGRRVDELLELAELSPSLRERYPHELSGGQRQRVGIARALALSPDLLIADEPTSALDVSVQARVLRLFGELRAELGFACLFISHDLAVVEQLADRVAVMRGGRLLELGPVGRVLARPAHPYTARLLAAVPVADPVRQRERRELWRAVAAG